MVGVLLCLCVSVLVGVRATPPLGCNPSEPNTKALPFCRTTLGIQERARDLVSRLTLEEKISQLGNTAPGVPRLGIPAYEWWSEALHGVSGYGRGVSFKGRIRAATSFPQVIVSASTFDSRLWYRIASAIATEGRAMFNEGQAKGLTFWAPNINIYRDPRWGRGHETPGEDPTVASRYALAFVTGFQGPQPHRLLLASACCKHFTAYDLDRWKAVTRFGFDARVTAQDLADTYQPPFKSCIKDGQASGIMCAYNRVNGVPNCADYNLLTNTARRQWSFNGYITSDCDAVNQIHDTHHYARLPEDAVADVLNAGMDVACGSYLTNYTKSAIQQRKLGASQIDRALHNLFSVRIRLGLFNGDPTQHPFANIRADQICTQLHQQLALQAARNGIVLLKNSANLLPLSKTRTPSLAVIGPNADNTYALLGNYEGQPCTSVSILQALKGYAASTSYHKGCLDGVACTNAAITDAVNVARYADYVVLVMGLDQTQETEDLDRVALTLPGQQETLIRAVATASKNPLVLVLVCGGPVDVSFAKCNPKIGSILWAGYPGEAGGIAIANILYGEHNPGGKLPMTWYPKEFINVPMTDMRMRPDPATGYPGRTYRFYNGRTVFAFGYGLSYTRYSYEFMSATPNTIRLSQLTPMIQATNRSSESIQHILVSDIGTDSCKSYRFSTHVRVENTGHIAGRHPVLLFVRHGKRRHGSPLKQLVGFESVDLNAGEVGEMEFVLDPCEHLSRAREDGLMVIEKGHRYLMVEGKEYPINIVL